jgi:hypothetical protein
MLKFFFKGTSLQFKNHLTLTSLSNPQEKFKKKKIIINRSDSFESFLKIQSSF